MSLSGLADAPTLRSKKGAGTSSRWGDFDMSLSGGGDDSFDGAFEALLEAPASSKPKSKKSSGSHQAKKSHKPKSALKQTSGFGQSKEIKSSKKSVSFANEEPSDTTKSSHSTRPNANTSRRNVAAETFSVLDDVLGEKPTKNTRAKAKPVRDEEFTALFSSIGLGGDSTDDQLSTSGQDEDDDFDTSYEPTSKYDTTASFSLSSSRSKNIHDTETNKSTSHVPARVRYDSLEDAGYMHTQSLGRDGKGFSYPSTAPKLEVVSSNRSNASRRIGISSRRSVNSPDTSNQVGFGSSEESQQDLTAFPTSKEDNSSFADSWGDDELPLADDDDDNTQRPSPATSRKSQSPKRSPEKLSRSTKSSVTNNRKMTEMSNQYDIHGNDRNKQNTNSLLSPGSYGSNDSGFDTQTATSGTVGRYESVRSSSRVPSYSDRAVDTDTRKGVHISRDQQGGVDTETKDLTSNDSSSSFVTSGNSQSPMYASPSKSHATELRSNDQPSTPPLERSRTYNHTLEDGSMPVDARRSIVQLSSPSPTRHTKGTAADRQSTMSQVKLGNSLTQQYASHLVKDMKTDNERNEMNPTQSAYNDNEVQQRTASDIVDTRGLQSINPKEHLQQDTSIRSPSRTDNVLTQQYASSQRPPIPVGSSTTVDTTSYWTEIDHSRRQLAGAHAEIDELRRQLRNCQQSTDDQIQSLQRTHMAELERIRAAHETNLRTELIRAETAAREERDRLQRDLDAQLRMAEARGAATAAELAQVHATNDAKITEAVARARQDERNTLETMHKSIVATLKAEHRHELERVRSSADESMQQMKARHEEEISSIYTRNQKDDTMTMFSSEFRSAIRNFEDLQRRVEAQAHTMSTFAHNHIDAREKVATEAQHGLRTTLTKCEAQTSRLEAMVKAFEASNTQIRQGLESDRSRLKSETESLIQLKETLRDESAAMRRLVQEERSQLNRERREFEQQRRDILRSIEVDRQSAEDARSEAENIRAAAIENKEKSTKEIQRELLSLQNAAKQYMNQLQDAGREEARLAHEREQLELEKKQLETRWSELQEAQNAFETRAQRLQNAAEIVKQRTEQLAQEKTEMIKLVEQSKAIQADANKTKADVQLHQSKLDAFKKQLENEKRQLADARVTLTEQRNQLYMDRAANTKTSLQVKSLELAWQKHFLHDSNTFSAPVHSSLANVGRDVPYDGLFHKKQPSMINDIENMYKNDLRSTGWNKSIQAIPMEYDDHPHQEIQLQHQTDIPKYSKINTSLHSSPADDPIVALVSDPLQSKQIPHNKQTVHQTKPYISMQQSTNQGNQLFDQLQKWQEEAQNTIDHVTNFSHLQTKPLPTDGGTMHTLMDRQKSDSGTAHILPDLYASTIQPISSQHTSSQHPSSREQPSSSQHPSSREQPSRSQHPSSSQYPSSSQPISSSQHISNQQFKDSITDRRSTSMLQQDVEQPSRSDASWIVTRSFSDLHPDSSVVQYKNPSSHPTSTAQNDVSMSRNTRTPTQIVFGGSTRNDRSISFSDATQNDMASHTYDGRLQDTTFQTLTTLSET